MILHHAKKIVQGGFLYDLTFGCLYDLSFFSLGSKWLIILLSIRPHFNFSIREVIGYKTSLFKNFYPQMAAYVTLPR